MATQTAASRPGRPLIAILLIIVALFAWMFGTGHRTPRLGLDLQGGTSITLVPRAASGGGKITSQQVDQAVDIIRQRVNGIGVAEAEVTKQGQGAGATIVISVPGQNQGKVVQLVGQTALLNFRPVLVEGAPQPGNGSTASPSPSASPPASASPSASIVSPTASPSPSSSSNGRVVPQALRAATTPSASASPTPTPSGSASPSASPSPSVDVAAIQQQYLALDCTKPESRRGGAGDDPNLPLVACDRNGTAKFILDKVAVSGRDISGAQAGIIQTTNEWVVNLTFNSKGTAEFAKTTQSLVSKQPPQNQFAIVLDGVVFSAPVVQSAIVDGRAQISGNFTQSSAQDLANVLKYGALPLAFDNANIETVSPTLGLDQLHAGLLAGAIGLGLVVLYSLLYYRGLGLVTIGSLTIAGLLTYGTIVLLGQTIGFTLTLAGIAGTIVAIGITADSFVVFFERLRDEVRDGKTLRVAVETGWHRARRTIVLADLVAVLAAVILYVLSIGSVRGFAFTLGLTTAIDLVVVFLFTKPLVTLLARTEFFGRGHKWSGLDPDRLGAKRPPSIIAAASERRRPASKEA